MPVRSEKEIAICEAIAVLGSDEEDMSRLRVSDIARMAGIGKGTVYEYYASKEEMFSDALLYILERELQLLLDTLERARSFRETVLEIISRFVALGPRGTLVIRMLFAEQSTESAKRCTAQAHDILADYRERLTAATDALVEIGIREGILGPCDADYRHTVLRCFYLGLIAFCPGDGHPAAQEEHVYTMLVKALQ